MIFLKYLHLKGAREKGGDREFRGWRVCTSFGSVGPTCTRGEGASHATSWKVSAIMKTTDQRRAC